MGLGPFWPGMQQTMGQTTTLAQSGGCYVQSSPKLLSVSAYLLTDATPLPNCFIPGSNPTVQTQGAALPKGLTAALLFLCIFYEFLRKI